MHHTQVKASSTRLSLARELSGGVAWHSWRCDFGCLRHHV